MRLALVKQVCQHTFDALQIGDAVWDRFADGACFVALAPVGDADRILPAIAQALDIADTGRPLAAALAERLRSEQTLLVLDTASDDAMRLYARQGWQRCGYIPDYALMPDGALCGTTLYYKSLHG